MMTMTATAEGPQLATMTEKKAKLSVASAPTKTLRFLNLPQQSTSHWMVLSRFVVQQEEK
jgi:hypothetical protein